MNRALGYSAHITVGCIRTVRTLRFTALDEASRYAWLARGKHSEAANIQLASAERLLRSERFYREQLAADGLTTV